MSLAGSWPVAGPSHRPPDGGPLPTGHPSREREDDALRAAALSPTLGGTAIMFEGNAVGRSADGDDAILDLTTIATPPISESRVADARAAHPSTSGAGSQRSERHLAVVKPIRPPSAPEAWSAGLWGSFA